MRSTLIMIAVLFLALLSQRVVAQATDQGEPPDGPPSETLTPSEPPVSVPSPGDKDPTKPVAKPVNALPASSSSVSGALNDKPGSELFVAAADAIKRAQSLSYRARTYATGAMFEPHTAKIQADVRMLRSSNAGSQTGGWLVRSTGSGIPKANADSMNFDVAWTGHNIEFVTHADKKVIEKRNPREAKNQYFQIATSSRNDELTSPRPFSKELAASVEYEVGPREVIDGVECDVVTAIFGEKKAKTRYAFATNDHLPRRIERIIEGSMASGTMVLELGAVEVDENNPPRLNSSLLKVDVPSGYTEERLPKFITQPNVKPPPADGGGKAVPEPVSGEIPPMPDPGASGVETRLDRMNGETAAVAVSPPAAAPPLTPVPPPLPELATPFELRSSNGDRVSLDSLRGNIVLVEFGGSWCLPCRKSHDELDGLIARFSGKPVKVIALSIRDKSPDGAIERFKQRTHQFPLLVEADTVAQQWGARTFPSYFIVGITGEILKSDQAYVKDVTIPALGDEIEKILRDMETGTTSTPAAKEAGPGAGPGPDGVPQT